MEYVTHNQQEIDTQHLTQSATIKATAEELTELFGEGMLGKPMWRVLFKDESVALIYPSHAEAFFVESRTKAGIDNVQITLDLAREKAEDKDPVHHAMSDAFAIFDSIKAGKGADYAKAVEICLLIRKRGHLLNAIVGAAVAAGAIPEEAYEGIMKIDSLTGAKTLGFVCEKIGLPPTKESGDELFAWSDKVMEAEQRAAQELFKHFVEGKDE